MFEDSSGLGDHPVIFEIDADRVTTGHSIDREIVGVREVKLDVCRIVERGKLGFPE
jgi:hypothetical protein